MAHNNVFNHKDPENLNARQEFSNVRITATIYANITPTQLQRIRQEYGEFDIGDRRQNNAITIEGIRDQVEQDDFLNAFRRYDPNAYRA